MVKITWYNLDSIRNKKFSDPMIKVLVKEAIKFSEKLYQVGIPKKQIRITVADKYFTGRYNAPVEVIVESPVTHEIQIIRTFSDLNVSRTLHFYISLSKKSVNVKKYERGD